MHYTAKKDKLELLEDNLKESDIFSKISDLTGLSIGKIWSNIKMIGSSKEFLVSMKKEFKVPELLEAENSVIAHNKLLLLKQDNLEEHGSVEFNEVLGEWKHWIRTEFVKRVLARKKV